MEVMIIKMVKLVNVTLDTTKMIILINVYLIVKLISLIKF